MNLGNRFVIPARAALTGVDSNCSVEFSRSSRFSRPLVKKPGSPLQGNPQLFHAHQPGGRGQFEQYIRRTKSQV